jgi:hypothetical protein
MKLFGGNKKGNLIFSLPLVVGLGVKVALTYMQCCTVFGTNVL